jgi:hypothetical protein
MASKELRSRIVGYLQDEIETLAGEKAPLQGLGSRSEMSDSDIAEPQEVTVDAQPEVLTIRPESRNITPPSNSR